MFPTNGAPRGFTCAAAAFRPGDDPELAVCEGEVRGRLLREPRGDQGFGYDPIFVPDGDSRTTAQMSAADKDRISHRGRALRELARTITPGCRAGLRLPPVRRAAPRTAGCGHFRNRSRTPMAFSRP